MKVYLRVLSIRKHKKVSFLNGFSNEFGILQFMVYNEIFDNINCGDLIYVDITETINNKGNNIKCITKINSIIKSTEFESYKGINNKIEDFRQQDFLNARNGGNQITLLKYKRQLLKKIREILDEMEFFDATNLLNTVEYLPNGSGIIEAEIKDRENGPSYLRITLENQLKQMMAITLNSVYAIDKVFRNMGEDSNHTNEFLMLEFVSLKMSIDDIINFIKKIDGLAKNMAKKYNLISELNDLEIIDYNDLVKYNKSFSEIKCNLINSLIVNFPCCSPFIKKDKTTGLQTEVRWYMDGKWISHFYNDENNEIVIRKILEKQMIETNKEKINELDYYKWGLPYTTSFGLSIDRWLQALLQKENISSITNPIQLDYLDRRLKKK